MYCHFTPARWIEAGYFPAICMNHYFFSPWGITTVHLIAENNSGGRLVGTVTAPVAMAITALPR